MQQRIALVTGGTGGIGTEICRCLAEQGRQIVAGYLPGDEPAAISWQTARRAEGLRIELAAGDVSSFESSADMVRDVQARIGPIDILVNCAGITQDKTLQKMEKEQWQAVLSTNLDSVFNVTRCVLDDMIGRGFGRIVNISSVNGQKGQFGQTNYSAAKAGVHGFTMALAQETARRGITVNTVSPGYVDTDMTRAMPAEIREAIVASIPLERAARPDEVGHAVAFLCADETSYITGINLPVNGGLYMS
ncbi:MAG: acetoacetyl-CoA reductase [Gammaproteobacteria bacterium]|jgi:acetoacetyl-CoA reductase|nr:acetoacetyl-CoA reductase [Gammaproteobacteria bacterium]